MVLFRISFGSFFGSSCCGGTSVTRLTPEYLFGFSEILSLMCTSPFFKILFLSHRIKIILNEENLESSKAKEAKGGKKSL